MMASKLGMDDEETLVGAKDDDVGFYSAKKRRYEHTCWYTLSIITSVVCCVPCGVVGLMNALIAKQEALRNNEPGYRNRIKNAKACTVLAVIFSLVTLASVAMLGFLFTTTLVQSHEVHRELNKAYQESVTYYLRAEDYFEYTTIGSFNNQYNAGKYINLSNPESSNWLLNYLQKVFERLNAKADAKQQTTPLSTGFMSTTASTKTGKRPYIISTTDWPEDDM